MTSRQASPSRIRPTIVGLLGLAAPLGACSALDDQSCEVPTGEMSAVALVVDSGWDLRASIDFEIGDRRGNGTPLYLCETDRLTINGQSPMQTAKADRIEYAISLATEASRSFTFVLDREAQGDRVTLSVDLPPSFELLTPIDGDTIPLGQDLPVEWEPANAGGIMRLSLEEELGGGECITTSAEQTYKEPGGVQVDDTGTWTMAGRDLSSSSPDPCDLTLTLARVTLGEYPTGLSSGGRIEASVVRYIDLYAEP